MGLTSVLKPDGFRPVGAGKLEYTFTESTVAGKPNYRVEIELDGFPDIPVIKYYPDSALEIVCDIAPILRTVLLMSEVSTERLLNTYVKYQAVWDGGSDAQVPLSSNPIYFYVGQDNYFNHRSKLYIDSSGGELLKYAGSILAWPGRTYYVDFLANLTDGYIVSDGTSKYYGDGSKHLFSKGFTTSVDKTISINKLGWTSGVSGEDNSWISVAYGNGTYVAVTQGGSNRVMYSTDGINWTAVAASGVKSWTSVCYGAGLFVVVGSGAGTSIVMTSPDGITWTNRTASVSNTWTCVCYGNGLFVAVAGSGTGDRVMTSSDGITWTTRTSAADNNWSSVIYGDSLYVAVATSGAGNRVMTSPDGTTWTLRTSAADSTWASITYGNNIYVAVCGTATASSVMTSPDGITWTLRTAPDATGTWTSVTYGDGIFIAVRSGATFMISNDGITWNLTTNSANRTWYAITYGNFLFVGVGISGTGDRAFYSSASTLYEMFEVEVQDECNNPIYLKWINDFGGLSVRLFDYDQTFSLIPEEDGRFPEKQVYAEGLTIEEWTALQELNRAGEEYGDNQKLGAYVVDFTDEDNPINVYPLPSQESTQTKKVQHFFGITLRYPKIYNSDI